MRLALAVANVGWQPSAAVPMGKEAHVRLRCRLRALALLSGAVVAVGAVGYAASSLTTKSLPTKSAAIRREPSAPLPNPCTLLADKEVAAAFGAPVNYRTAQPGYHQCTWDGAPFANQFGKQGLTLSVARVSERRFVAASSIWIAPGSEPGSRVRTRSTRVRGVGQIAFTQPAAGYDLEVWYQGIAYYVGSVFLPRPLATEKRLVLNVIARLKQARAETSAR